MQISSKIMQQIPNFANFIKFRHNHDEFHSHDGQLSSFRQFFVKKRNLLEPTNISISLFVDK